MVKEKMSPVFKYITWSLRSILLSWILEQNVSCLLLAIISVSWRTSKASEHQSKIIFVWKVIDVIVEFLLLVILAHIFILVTFFHHVLFFLVFFRHHLDPWIMLDNHLVTIHIVIEIIVFFIDAFILIHDIVFFDKVVLIIFMDVFIIAVIVDFRIFLSRYGLAMFRLELVQILLLGQGPFTVGIIVVLL